MIQKTVLFLISTVLVAGGCKHGGDTEAKLRLEQGWVMEVPDVQNVTGAYLSIENPSSSSEFLIGVSADVAASAEMHESSVVDGMMKMAKVDSIEIPPGGRVELKRGGLHIMLIGLKHPVHSGDTVNLKLEFKNAGALELPVPVKALNDGGQMMDHGMEHGMDHSMEHEHH